jgi:hypothetical protein
MSNKKKRNRKASTFRSGSGLPGTAGHTSLISPDDAGQSTVNKAGGSKAARSRFSGMLTYLRTHLLLVGIIGLVAFGALGSALKYLDEEAQREIARRNASKGRLNNRQSESLLNKINPFLPDPTPTPTPQLSKEYIYAGSRLLAVEDANANVAPPADLAIWRPSNGEWWVMGSTGGSQQVTYQWGITGDDPVEGDYDGDGKTDFAVFRESNGTWYIVNSGGGGGQFVFGQTGDKAAPADYDGDGRTDAAVYRAGTWYIQRSSDNQTVQAQLGVSSDTPAPADYDGDGRADIAVWRNSETKFYSINSSNGIYQTPVIGQVGEPVPGDYDGDGRANFAVKNGANWVIMNGALTQTQTIAWQQSNDIPVQNDYDGDSKVDIAVFRSADSSQGAGDAGNWYIKNSSTGQTRTEHWGAAGDYPVPAYYRR